MSELELPRITLKTEVEPPQGMNIYQAIPEMVEFRRLETAPPKARTLGLGRMVITLDGENGELVALQSYVKTGRWKTGEAETPPMPDAEGALIIAYPGGTEDFAYLPAEPRFIWHDESSSLRISLGEGTALVFKVADCLLVGVDREGGLTDIWMLGIDLSLE
jgi:hypothetical protein